jgi:hypothetical protein
VAFLPYERYELLTALTQDELLERLFLNVKAYERFSLFPPAKEGSLYEGSVSPHEFHIHKVINYRNSFNPEIKGTIKTDTEGCKISIVVKLNPVVFAFMCVWMGGALCGAISVVVIDIQQNKFDPASLIIIGMFLFGYVLATGGFKFESGDARIFLKKLFDAEEL